MQFLIDLVLFGLALPIGMFCAGVVYLLSEDSIDDWLPYFVGFFVVGGAAAFFMTGNLLAREFWMVSTIYSAISVVGGGIFIMITEYEEKNQAIGFGPSTFLFFCLAGLTAVFVVDLPSNFSVSNKLANSMALAAFFTLWFVPSFVYLKWHEDDGKKSQAAKRAATAQLPEKESSQEDLEHPSRIPGIEYPDVTQYADRLKELFSTGKWKIEHHQGGPHDQWPSNPSQAQYAYPFEKEWIAGNMINITVDPGKEVSLTFLSDTPPYASTNLTFYTEAYEGPASTMWRKAYPTEIEIDHKPSTPHQKGRTVVTVSTTGLFTRDNEFDYEHGDPRQFGQYTIYWRIVKISDE